MKRTEKRWGLWDKEANSWHLLPPNWTKKDADKTCVTGIEQVVRVTIEFEVPDEGQ